MQQFLKHVMQEASLHCFSSFEFNESLKSVKKCLEAFLNPTATEKKNCNREKQQHIQTDHVLIESSLPGEG